MSHPFWFAGSAMDWDDPLFSDEEEFLFFIDGFDREETPSLPTPWITDFPPAPETGSSEDGRKLQSGISESPNRRLRC